uniref:Uncharacterized protein n=1 Tax=Panagrolaimus superbus TaxID=310955 RepID=A0A914YFZ8_9BILA
MFDPGYDILVKNQYPLGKTWLTTSPELYKIVFGDTLFNEHVSTIRWNTKLLEDAFFRGSILEELHEIKDAFITIFKLMGRYRFSFEATMESFIKKLVPTSIKALEDCGGNVNKLSAEDTFILLAEAYEIMCCDLELLERCGINEKDLRPEVIAQNEKKFNFYYFGWDLIFCTTPVKIDGEFQESKPYAVAFNNPGFTYLFNNFISGNTRRKSQHMSAKLVEINDKIQEFNSSMETRRLPSLRIQKKLRAPSQPIYEPLALRTRRGGDNKVSSEPTRDDMLKQQKEGRAARFARRQEALDLEREKRFLNGVIEPSPLPSELEHDPQPAAVELDYLDILINNVIEKAGDMAKALKRRKRPKGANQFYDDDTFLPADDIKYIRVENLSGDVKAEIRKQMNQGRAARLEARNDPTAIKTSTPEVSLSAAITNVKQQHHEQEPIPQPAAMEVKHVVSTTTPKHNLSSKTFDSPPVFSPAPKPAILKKPLYTHCVPIQNIPTTRPMARPTISYRRPLTNNVISSNPTNALYRPILASSSQGTMFIHSPGNPSSPRLIRVFRQPSLRYSSPLMRPVKSQIYLSNGTPLMRPSFQPNYVRRVVSYDSPRMVVRTNNSLQPGIYHQATPNTFVQTNNNLSSNVFPINSNNINNGTETILTTNGKITENGVLNKMPPPTLKPFYQDQVTVELSNGLKPEDKVLSANQSSNQNF